MQEVVLAVDALHHLPLARWAKRFCSGQVAVRAQVVREYQVALGRSTLTVPMGSVRLDLQFRGGADPSLLRAVLVGSFVLDGVSIRELVLVDGRVFADGVQHGELSGPIAPLRALVEHFTQVRVAATARPQGPLLVKFGPGLRVHVRGDALVSVEGAATGPARGLRLSGPLVLSVDGEGVRLDHEPLGLLSSLARLRISSATLHPDGTVNLDGGAARPLNRAVRVGLRQASKTLTRMLRTSPRYARVRTFLTPA